jgi:cell division protease FtsH
MNEKRRPGRFSLLVYLVIAVLAALVIYMVVGQFSNQYQSISFSDAITLIYDDENNEKVIGVASYEKNNNDDSGTLQMTVFNKDTVNDKYEVVGYYTLSGPSEQFTDPEYSVGFPAHANKSILVAVQGEVNDAKTLFSNAGQNDLVSQVTFETSTYHENAFLSRLPTILVLVVTIGIAYIFFKMIMASGSSNAKALDFNKSRARRVDDSKIRFSDVAGCDEEKAELVEVVDYLKDPKKYTKFGAKLPKGILLVGPPGTGKTLLAKAVAGEAGVPFFSISGSDFVEMFVGVGAGRVRDLFKTAKQNAPCLIFIDEIDAVGRQRGAGLGGGNDEREQTLNQLLVELDGFEENSGIIVIAATNREDVLDPALLRAGRFDRQITVNLPDREGREAIFKVHAKNKKMDPSIDFGQLAKRTVGFSGADIANILNEAAILAVRRKGDSIVMADIDEAIDRRIAGPAKSSKGMSEKERQQVAYHEAGHAIIGLTLPNADKVRKITIIPRGRTGGHVLMGPDDDRFLLTKSELEAEITGLLGGRSSEEIFFKDVSTGASNDIERATQIARSMVVEYGMSSLGPIQYEKDTGSVFLGRDYTNAQKNFSSAVAEEIDKEVRKIIDNSHAEAIKIITERKVDVELIAKTLLEYETINEEEISYLLKNRKMPDEKVVQAASAQRNNAVTSGEEDSEKKAGENDDGGDGTKSA